MAKEEEDGKIKKKLFHVMVESLQNIAKHSEEDDAEYSKNYRSGQGILMVGKEKDRYSVTTGNLVSVEQAKELGDMISEINAMDADELKETYKKKLKESRLSDKGGAGLGLIDMAKKTGTKIECSFKEVNAEQHFFILKININRS